MKNIRFTKILRQIKFDEAFGKLEAKNYFQRQSWTK